MGKPRGDPLESAIENTLAPGAFIGYRDSWDFVEALEAIETKITPLIKQGEAGRAVALLETFIAGCHEKAEEIDDSSGSFGTFVGALFCDWIRALQAAKSDPDQTAATLLAWMENDDYGFCHRLENEAVKVFDRKGLVAFERAVRELSDGSGKDSYAHRRKVELLKTIHEKRRDVEAYAALCEAEEDLAPRDCEVLAEMCLKRRRPEAALAWVERGLDQEAKAAGPNRSAWRLPVLKREVLQKLGRSGEALALAWEDYRRAPSVFSYADLMELLPKGEHPAWHEKAMAALDGGDLPATIDLLVQTGELDRLAGLVEDATRETLAGLSHYTAEPAAKKLERPYPLPAAKLRIAMALAIVEAKKSRYYDAALRHLEKARKLLLREERAGEWEALTDEIRERHRRKSGFMPGFERLANGRPSREPSFLDRARRRWDRESNRRRGRS